VQGEAFISEADLISRRVCGSDQPGRHRHIVVKDIAPLRRARELCLGTRRDEKLALLGGVVAARPADSKSRGEVGGLRPSASRLTLGP